MASLSPINLENGVRYLRLLLSALIWAGSFFCSAMAAAQDTQEVSVSRLITLGRIDEASAALEAQDPSEADKAFFVGRVLKAQRRYDDAIDVFRHVLRIAPDYLNARRELAHTLMLNRDYGPAEYHFEALLRIDQNARMRAGYRRFLNIINQNKPVGVSGYFALLPSTNVNRGTTNTVFDTNLGQFVIDPNSRADSGIGAQAGLSGYFRKILGPTERVSVNWSLSGTVYEEDDDNSATGTIALTYERVTRMASWSAGPYLRLMWEEDNGESRASGLHAGFSRRLGDRDRISVSLSHEYRSYAEQDYRDGPFTSASLRLARQFSPSLSAGIGLGFERSDPDAEHQKFGGRMLSLDVSNTWRGGLAAGFGVEWGKRNFDGDYPLTSTPREDEFVDLTASIQHSKIDFGGFTPRLVCSHKVQESNVAFFDYTATECRANISRNF